MINIEKNENINIELRSQACNELKTAIVSLAFEFVDKYSAKSENCIYPYPGYILVKVLSECLSEAKMQIIVSDNLQCEISINEWIDIKLAAIAKKLSKLVYSARTFECGYQTGYKSALLDIEKLIEGGAQLKQSICWCQDKYHDAGEICL